MYVMGAMSGANLSFFIGRRLGRDFAASVIGARLKRYDEAILRNGFATKLYLRLIYLSFNVMNFGMGLTAVRSNALRRRFTRHIARLLWVCRASAGALEKALTLSVYRIL